MALLPAVSGMIASAFDGGRLWLTFAWLLCYCVQFTVARWLRSRFRRRYLPPVVAYAAALAVIGIPLVVLHPRLLIWAPWYAVCAGVTFLGAWLRRDRSLWANAASVSAASMMAAVVCAFDDPMSSALLPRGLALAAIVALTQYGSVLYVKTMIRERRNPRYLAASWIWHVALVILAPFVPGSSAVPLTAISAALLARAVMLPLIGRRTHVRPIVVGLVEMVFSLAVCLTAPFCVAWMMV